MSHFQVSQDLDESFQVSQDLDESFQVSQDLDESFQVSQDLDEVSPSEGGHGLADEERVNGVLIAGTVYRNSCESADSWPPR